MPEVLINGRFLGQVPTGVQRYAREVLRAIDRGLESGWVPPSLRFTLLAPRGTPAPDDLRHVAFRTGGRLSGHAWEQVELPFLARGRLLWNPCNTGPLLVRNQLLTIHDAAVFDVGQSYSRPFRLWYRCMHRWLTRFARALVTVSHFSRERLIRHCGPAARRIRVIPLGSEHVRAQDGDPRVLDRHGLRARPYVLTVGSRALHKNQGVVAEAAGLIRGDAEVVAVGGENGRVFHGTGRADRPGCRELGYVSDAELRSLYEHAACFVHPSLHEGFGLPPLEAMAAGCPVVVSRAASLPEVCGDAALYFEPTDAGNLAEHIDTLLSDGAAREDLRRRGLERAAGFSWDACARAHVELIQEVYNDDRDQERHRP